MFYVYRNKEMTLHEDISEIRTNKENFELFIDLETMEFREHSRGQVNLTRKRTLGKLLCYLLMKSPKKFTANELYMGVWGVNALPLSQEVSVKTAISRLRKLIESDTEYRYILKTQPDFLGRRGQYYFNPDCEYCLLRPSQIHIF